MDSHNSQPTKPTDELVGVKENGIVRELKELKQNRMVENGMVGRSQHRKRKRSAEDCSSPEFLTAEKVNIKKVKIPNNEEKESLLQSTLASHWATIIQEGLFQTVKKELLTDYQPTAEYAGLAAPGLNPELTFILSENSLRSDECKAQLQNHLSSAMVGLGKLIISVLSSYDSGPTTPMSIEILFDIAMILGNVHHEISLQRRSTIISAFDLEGITDCSKVKEMLFSEKLLNIIKTARMQNMEERDDKTTIKLIESSVHVARNCEERNKTEKDKNTELEKEKSTGGPEKEKNTKELGKEKITDGPEKEKSTGELEKEKNAEGPEKDKNTEELEKEKTTQSPGKEKNTEELEKKKNTEGTEKEKSTEELREEKITEGTEKEKNTAELEKEKTTEGPDKEKNTEELEKENNTGGPVKEKKNIEPGGTGKNTEDSGKGKSEKPQKENNPKEPLDGGKTSEESNIRDSSQITIEERETLVKNTNNEAAIQINQETADVIRLEVKNASLRIIEELHATREKTIEALQMNSTHLKPEKTAPGRLGPEDPFPGFREAYRRKCRALGFCEHAANTVVNCLKDSTVKTYERPIRLWWEFCRTNNYDVFRGSEQNVTQFLAENDHIITSGGVLTSWKSAFCRFTTTDLNQSQIFTDYVTGFKSLRGEDDKKVKGRKKML